MKYTFCTLFNIKFLHKALALYDSCLKHCGGNFTLWALCLDDVSYDILQRMSLPNINILKVSDLNDTELEATRSSRSMSEFAWTCKAPLIQFTLRQVPPDSVIAYLDADQFLFADLTDLYTSFEGYSIMITPHRFAPKDEHKAPIVGKNNAGMIYFRNDKTAIQCLSYWKKQCIEYCKHEAGRMGDQSYLDNWPELYPGKVLQIPHPGVNAGTWNLHNFPVSTKAGKVYVDDVPLVWYHFHGFKTYLDRSGVLQAYPVNVGYAPIYKPYILALQDAVRKIHSHDPEYLFSTDPYPGTLRIIKQKLFRLFSRTH